MISYSSLTEKNDEKRAEKHKKSRPWLLDPSTFQPLPRKGFFRRHLLGRLRSLGKYVLYSLVFSYPVLLVSLAIIFGGIVFWVGLFVSVGLMWLIIKKAGYARNFASWGVGNTRFLGLIGAFGLVLAFYYGLFHLREWFLPVFGGVLVVALILGLRRFS